MHALITGGCGFVGSNLALAFRSAGWEVTCFDSLMRRGSELTLRRVIGAGCHFVHGDVRNREDLDRLDGGFDLLVECSEEPSVLAGRDGRDARLLIANNLFGTDGKGFGLNDGFVEDEVDGERIDAGAGGD